MTLLITTVVLVATLIQTWSSVIELGRANRPAVDWMNAEDDLIDAEPRLRRRRARRDLRAERDAQLDTEIRRIKLTLASWVMLTAAAGAALLTELVGPMS